MAQIFNIGTDQLVRFTNRLEKMKRSDLPVVIRQTLNKAAFDMRTKSLPKTYSSSFIKKDKNFLKSRARFSMAKGLNIASMNSSVGLLRDGSKATEGLAKQETGGILKKKTFIAMDQARVSGSRAKKISKRSRLSNIKGIKRIRANNKRGFMREAKRAGSGGHLIYGRILYEIRNSKREKITAKPLYSVQKGRSVNVKSRPFIKTAAIMQGAKMANNFATLALKRIKK